MWILGLLLFVFLWVAIFAGIPEANAEIADHVVISEFTTRGPGGSTDEFVELYNPTNESVDISGWAIWTYNASTLFCREWCERIQFPGAADSNTTVIPAKRYLLVADSCWGYTGPIPDKWFVCAVGFKDDNGTIRLIKDPYGANITIDTVAWGEGYFPEGGVAAPRRGYNDDAKSAARKASATSTKISMAPGGSEYVCGNGWDTDNNGADFFVKTIREPQGLNNGSEPPDTVTVILDKTVGTPNCTGVSGADYCVTTSTPIHIDASIFGCCPDPIAYSLEGGAWTQLITLPYTFYFTSEGYHTLDIKVDDCLGHTTYDNETFFVDDTAPVINKTVGEPNCTIIPGVEYCVTTGTPTVIDVDFGCCDVGTVAYNNGSGWVEISAVLPFTHYFDSACDQWLNITATDCFGRMVYDNETFHVDDSPPVIDTIVGEPNVDLGCGFFILATTTPLTINVSDAGCCPNMTVEFRIWNATSDTGWMNIPTVPYTFTFTERCTHNLSIRAYDCLGRMVYHENQTFLVDHIPQGASSEINQSIKDIFFENEDVYALGGGFNSSDWIDIYVVPDRNWTDQDPIPIPDDVSGGVETVQTDGNGDVHALVWPAPLIVGSYDIIYDSDQDGIYNWGIDAIDGASPGFSVRELPAQAPILSAVGLALLVTMMSFIAIRAIRKKQR